jgi:hypothetical protein
MFLNEIVCEKELPIPFDRMDEDDLPKMECINWQEHEFKTDYFSKNVINDGWLDESTYSISEDGRLYKEKIKTNMIINKDGEMEQSLVDDGVERQDITGEIFLQDLFMGKKHDYIMQFKAVFFKGDLMELSLSEWEKMDNTERKAIQEKIGLEIKRVEEKQNRMNNSFLYKIFYYFVSILLKLLAWEARIVARISLKLKSWIS